jgi:hypothetical protein
MLAVVSKLGAVQAQMMSAAELQLWARIEELPSSAVQDALWKDRTLIKTWMNRGTLHLLTAADFALYTAGVGYVLNEAFRKISKMPSWEKYHGVTAAGLEPITLGIKAVLGDQPITREQLADAVAAHTKMPALSELMRSGWGSLLKPAASQGFLCFGPSEGQKVTFISPEKWMGEWRSIDTEQALLQLAVRFLATYGPDMPDAFARWIGGIEPSHAKKLFRALGDTIIPIEVEGWKAFALAETVHHLRAANLDDAVECVRLLPNFDNYTLHVTPHAHSLMAAEQKPRVYRKSAWVSPVLLVGGRIEGVWEYKKKGTGKNTRTLVTIESFSPSIAKKVKKGIEAEAARLGTFLGTPIEIEYTS